MGSIPQRSFDPSERFSIIDNSTTSNHFNAHLLPTRAHLYVAIPALWHPNRVTEKRERECLDYLAGKGILKIKPQRIGQMAIWSCRFWAAYVVLYVLLSPSSLLTSIDHFSLSNSQILHIRRSFVLLSREKNTILRSTRQRIASGKHDSEASDNEKKQLKALQMKSDDLKNDCWVQAGYLPLTAHWYALLFFFATEWVWGSSWSVVLWV